MYRVGITEAKARFSRLVARAERGQETQITRNGTVVARLVPAVKAQRARNPNAAVIDRIVAFSKTLEIKGRVNVRKLIEDARPCE